MRNIDEMTSKRSHVYSKSRSTNQYTTSSRSHGGYMNLFFYKHMNPSGSYSQCIFLYYERLHEIYYELQPYSYTYNHAGRPTATKYTMNDLPEVLLSELTYNELGQVETKAIDNGSQTTAYSYNVRGWLASQTSVNFSEWLYYNTHPSAGNTYYNGNISAVKWKYATSTEEGYSFEYDGLNRMTNSSYGEGSILSANTDRYSEIVSYNKNGGIVSLQRYGAIGSSGNWLNPYIYGLIDDLSFDYYGNQITEVYDAAAPVNVPLMQFNGGFSSSFPCYSYNSNGARKWDVSKNTSIIQYNLLNLPSMLQTGQGHKINYSYSVSGEKLRTEHITAQGVTVPVSTIVELTSNQIKNILITDYVGNKIYEDGTLKMIRNPEGYMAYERDPVQIFGTPTSYSWYYYYNLRDHLGSNRVVTKDNTIMENTSYYPFGMLLGDKTMQLIYVYAPYDTRDPFKYNNKELDQMHGVDWYDYGARLYDGMGWMVPDPLAEKYYSISPYAYALNNPVKFIDPTGEEIWIYYDDENGKTHAWLFNGSNQNQAPKNQFVSDFITAYNYNVKNGGGEQLQAAATATDYTLNLAQTENNSSFQTTFNGPRTEGTVFWNPTEGLETSKGTLSPATILEHEMDHGVDWQTNTIEHIKGQKTSDSYFKNMEEKRVITGSEYKTGVANGEFKPITKGRENNNYSYRKHGTNSGNIFIPVTSPISNKKKP